MKLIDGKVWLWNVDKNIENLFELNLASETYLKLVSIGAKFSFENAIGNDYAVENCKGVYCDNLTITEIERAFKEAHQHDEKEQKDKLYVEEIYLMQGITVESVFKAICKRCENYYWSMLVQNKYGQPIPFESEYGLYDEDYENITRHAISTLSIEERGLLLEKVQEAIKNTTERYRARILELVAGDIQNSLTTQKHH